MSRYLTNVALAIKGDRVERGTEVELTAVEAANFDSADITPVGAVVSEPKVEESPVSVTEMTLNQLKERAKELGLSTSGSKADLQERIALHLAGNAEGQPEGEESDSANSGEGESEDAEGQPEGEGQGDVTSE